MNTQNIQNTLVTNCQKFILDTFGLDDVNIDWGIESDAYVNFITRTIHLPSDCPPETVFGLISSLIATLLYTNGEVIRECKSPFTAQLLMAAENYRAEKLLIIDYPQTIDYLQETDKYFAGKVDKMIDYLPRQIQFIVAIRKTLENRPSELFEFKPVLLSVMEEIEALKTAKSTEENLKIVKRLAEKADKGFYQLPPRLGMSNNECSCGEIHDSMNKKSKIVH